ncbi:NmrA family NAD(P)-binding protein [Nocardia grenadensis]|uniref:NmrA family NAD(P)-binding protein n=1 Tax=Nocardia grenadensis TaxID=931537 RepID=UPI003D941EDE
MTVLGATGRTGRLVVDRAPARGHRVTAIVRQSAHRIPGATGVNTEPALHADHRIPRAGFLAGTPSGGYTAAALACCAGFAVWNTCGPGPRSPSERAGGQFLPVRFRTRAHRLGEVRFAETFS